MWFVLARCEAQHGAGLSGMPAWALASGAVADPAPLTRWFGSLPAPTAYSPGIPHPFLGKIRGPCHRPFWLHGCRRRPCETSCHRHHALPRSVSHIDPGLLAGTGTAVPKGGCRAWRRPQAEGGTGDKCKRDGAGRSRCGEQEAAAESARLGAGVVFRDFPPGVEAACGWRQQLRSAAVLPF